jgi:hypothetical protein
LGMRRDGAILPAVRIGGRLQLVGSVGVDEFQRCRGGESDELIIIGGGFSGGRAVTLIGCPGTEEEEMRAPAIGEDGTIRGLISWSTVVIWFLVVICATDGSPSNTGVGQ